MATMTDAQILELARGAVPDHIRPLGRIVSKPGPVGARGMPAMAGVEGDSVIDKLVKRVGAKPPAAASQSAEVEFVEHTPLGARTTVVHVRDGKVERVLKRA